MSSLSIGGFMEYRPINKRISDFQYRDLLTRILREGVKVLPQQEEEALMILGYQMRFDLSNGFPIITERDLVSANPGQEKWSVFNQSLGELFAFLHGAQTQKELEVWGCRWWSRWVTKEKCEKRGLAEGDLGPGSYGAAWRRFPDSRNGTSCQFDQITHLLEQITELPHLRTHFVSPWIPQFIGRGKGKQQKVVVAPCHGWFHVLINTMTSELSLHHFQRSCDVPVGLVCNLIEYGALTLMLAQVTGYKAKELVFTTSDTHIYCKQEKDVLDMLGTRPQVLPMVTINPDVKNLFDFRQHHFQVSDYRPQLPRRRIWTPV